MTTLEILKAARDLLSDEKRWTKGTYARKEAYRADIENHDAEPNDIRRLRVRATDKNAVCFCPLGAISQVTTLSPYIIPHHEIRALGFVDACDLFNWNDAPKRTHAEVLQRFDDAIARLTAQTVSS